VRPCEQHHSCRPQAGNAAVATLPAGDWGAQPSSEAGARGVARTAHSTGKPIPVVTA